MMHINGKSLSISLALLVLIAYHHSVLATPTVTFKGVLTDQTCSVAVADEAITVDFGTMPTTEFATSGAKSTDKKFDIKLSNCPANINDPFIQFTGTSSSSAADGAAIFDNQASGGATGIGAIMHIGVNPVKNNTKMASNAVFSSGAGTISITSNLIATAAATKGTDGNINIPVTFNISYN